VLLVPLMIKDSFLLSLLTAAPTRITTIYSFASFGATRNIVRFTPSKQGFAV
jgi:hypothetical protein